MVRMGHAMSCLTQKVFHREILISATVQRVTKGFIAGA
jgi:hypothetical protein